jgi:hypothetical protein
LQFFETKSANFFANVSVFLAKIFSKIIILAPGTNHSLEATADDGRLLVLLDVPDHDRHQRLGQLLELGRVAAFEKADGKLE